MDLYRHYKGKNYRLIGKVLHSETLELLVLYEALYAQEKSKLWVRPERMFFETICRDGKDERRFEKISFSAHLIAQAEDLDSLSSEQLQRILKQTRKNQYELLEDLGRGQRYRLLVAELDEELCAFISGFEKGEGNFHCDAWGRTDARLSAEALAFLERKLQLLGRESGYRAVSVRLPAGQREEITLALQAGYTISGTEGKGPALEVTLERRL